MKKVLWLIVCLMTMVFTSCTTTHKYIASAEYEVCYPDGTQKFNESVTIRSASEPSIACYSRNGTNYLTVVGICAPDILLRSSTAPIRLKTYDVELVKKKVKKYNGNDDVYH